MDWPWSQRVWNVEVSLYKAEQISIQVVRPRYSNRSVTMTGVQKFCVGFEAGT